MDKNEKLLKSEILTAVFAVLILGGAGYTGYSLYYVVTRMDSYGEVTLYGALSALLASLSALLYTFAAGKGKVKKVLIPLAAGVLTGVVYAFMILLLLSMNTVEDIYEAAAFLFIGVLAAVVGIFLAAAFFVKSKKSYKILNRVIAAVLAISVLGGIIMCSSEALNDRSFVFYDKSVDGFEPVTAEEIKLTANELAASEKWYYENIVNAGKNGIAPAYDFTVDGVSLRNSLSEWTFETTEKAENGAVNNVVTLTNAAKNLKATVSAVLYKEKATCNWSVCIENTGSGNSGIITDFYAIDTDLAKGANANIYYCHGSDCTVNDFKLYTRNMDEGKKVFGSIDRTTTEFLPYFNFVSDSGAFVLASGWTGSWKASFESQENTVNVKISQKKFASYLTAGEKAFSPEVSLTLYEGKALKGFNIFRKFVKEDITPANISQAVYQCAGGGTFDTQAALGEITKSGVSKYIDCFWFDAEAWFYDDTKSNWYDNAGNWTERTDIFPNGFEEVTAMLKNENIGTMLWFEPERVRKDTIFYNEAVKNGWLIDNGTDNYMLNLADDGACDFLCEYMANFIKENGISEYRQDFNYSPEEYWAKADGKNRTGITENHYVRNLYRYLGYLLENVEGLKIDNCASGGRRLDLSMMRYSVPLWRSDYQCNDHPDNAESAQVQTYGLSLFLPYSNIGNPWEDSLYEYASNITSIKEVYHLFAVQNAEVCKDFLAKYVSVRHHLIENYYPLTGSATVSPSEWVAMQFGTEKEGLISGYRHAEAPDTLTVKLSGLDPDAEYTFSYVFDTERKDFTLKGSEAAAGFDLAAKEAPEAVIIEYKAK